MYGYNKYITFVAFEKQLVDSSRFIADAVADTVGADQQKFSQLMKLAFSADNTLAMRASRAATFCVMRHRELLVPHINRIIKKLDVFNNSVSKNFLKLFVEYPYTIPEKQMGKLIDYCYERLLSYKEIPSVRIYSLYILYNFSRIEKDFKPELVHIFEEALMEGSVGFINSGKKILTKLKKEIADGI